MNAPPSQSQSSAPTLDGMAEFLFSRAEGAPPRGLEPDDIGTPMFFQMWRTRKHPYHTLAEGDTLWWADQRSREVCWELRVRNLRRSQYHSVAGGLDRLRRWFGMLPMDLNGYHHGVPPEGWLLAWDCDVVGSVEVTLPRGCQLGRNGFRQVESSEARLLGLPAPGRPAKWPADELPAEPDLLAPPRTRHIPVSVRNEVLERDGRRCVLCGAGDPPMHIDHIYPYSKGGSNDADNLQVLCGPCNIAKGAAAVSGVVLVPVIEELGRVAAERQRAVPRDPADLAQFIGELVADGRGADALELAWAIERHPDAGVAVVDGVSSALDALDGDLAVHAQLYGAVIAGEPVDPLIELAAHDDPEISHRAAVCLAQELPEDRAMPYARQGYASQDRYVRAQAALQIGALTSDDDEWRSMLLEAYEQGDPLTRSTAAFWLGAEADDEQFAFVLLEEAMRSPLPGVAAAAARAIGKLFADDPAAAERYEQAAREIEPR